MALRIIALLISVFVISCNTGGEDGSGSKLSKSMQLEQDIYNRSAEVRDYYTALGAAYKLSSVDSTYQDSIIINYMRLKNYPAVYKLGTKKIVEEPRNEWLLNLVIDACRQLEQYTDAIGYLQELGNVKTADSTKINYDLGELFFRIKNYRTAQDYMMKVMRAPDSRVLSEKLPMSTGEYQDIPYYLLAKNMLGFMDIINGEYERAEKTYTEILSFNPDFELAKNNMQYLKEAQAQK